MPDDHLKSRPVAAVFDALQEAVARLRDAVGLEERH
jgi:hypothetical protein